MDTKLKSSVLLKIFLILSFVSMTGCENIELPHVFSGNEVPAGALNEPRLVATPAPSNPQTVPVWPRLGDVPSKPQDFPPPGTITTMMSQMDKDRNDAQTMQQSVEGSILLVPPKLPTQQ